MTIAPYARAAWALGVAEVGEAAWPLTESLGMAMQRAVRVAEAVEGYPGVLENVRREARRQALYHAFYRRHDELERRMWVRLRPVMREVGLRIAPVIAGRLASKRLVTQEDDQVQPSPREVGQSAAQDALGGLVDTAVWGEWAALTREAYQQALAEGDVRGASYVADLMNRTVPVFDVRFEQALARIRQLDDITAADVEGWVGEQADGLAYELGGALADGIESGQMAGELRGTVMRVMTADENTADLVLNHIMGRGLSEGSLSVYRDDGLANVDILVSPGACDECADDEASNPYPVDEAPDVPVHPRCRCALAPSWDQGDAQITVDDGGEE